MARAQSRRRVPPETDGAERCCPWRGEGMDSGDSTRLEFGPVVRGRWGPETAERGKVVRSVPVTAEAGPSILFRSPWTSDWAEGGAPRCLMPMGTVPQVCPAELSEEGSGPLGPRVVVRGLCPLGAVFSGEGRWALCGLTAAVHRADSGGARGRPSMSSGSLSPLWNPGLSLHLRAGELQQ